MELYDPALVFFLPICRTPRANTLVQLAKAAATLNEHGARQVFAIVTHGILSGNAIDNINQSCLSGLVVTNSECTLALRLRLMANNLTAVPRMSPTLTLPLLFTSESPVTWTNQRL